MRVSMSYPIWQCSRIFLFSASSRGPGLRRMLSGMAILPMSWRKAARARTGRYGSGTGIVFAMEIQNAVTRWQWPSVSASFKSSALPRASKVSS